MSFYDFTGNYKVVLGDSLLNEPNTKKTKYYELKEKFNRSTPQINIEVLQEAEKVRARLIPNPKSNQDTFMLEAESQKHSRVCTFEGSTEVEQQDNAEINCILLYDKVKNVLVLEKVSEKFDLKTGSGMSLQYKRKNQLSDSKVISELSLPPKKMPQTIQQNTENYTHKGRLANDNNRDSLNSSSTKQQTDNNDEWDEFENDLNDAINEEIDDEFTEVNVETPITETRPRRESVKRNSLFGDSEDEDHFEEVLEPKPQFPNRNISKNTTKSNYGNNDDTLKRDKNRDSKMFDVESINEEPTEYISDFEFEEVVPTPVDLKHDFGRTQTSAKIHNEGSDHNAEDSFSDLEKEMEESLM
ncbi:hypothetical protein BB559_003941 [Furculomyces boomerangus]|uniref:Transcription elongation factor Eaf N-terminal domain-containing protein n=1 Tax=Furculomyces boomerangus TaxID=61424 RepID=A0A2T9YHQ3_9FUNG|nr:hypothetical protein BB559_003941 [Furculomyces boomerangus]